MGNPSKRSGRERRKRGRWRGAEGGTGAKIRKLKKCRPALEEGSRVVDVRLIVITASSSPASRTSHCLVTQNDRNVGPLPCPHRPSLLSVINRICSLSPIRSLVFSQDLLPILLPLSLDTFRVRSPYNATLPCHQVTPRTQATPSSSSSSSTVTTTTASSLSSREEALSRGDISSCPAKETSSSQQQKIKRNAERGLVPVISLRIIRSQK